MKKIVVSIGIGLITLNSYAQTKDESKPKIRVEVQGGIGGLNKNETLTHSKTGPYGSRHYTVLDVNSKANTSYLGVQALRKLGKSGKVEVGVSLGLLNSTEKYEAFGLGTSYVVSPIMLGYDPNNPPPINAPQSGEVVLSQTAIKKYGLKETRSAAVVGMPVRYNILSKSNIEVYTQATPAVAVVRKTSTSSVSSVRDLSSFTLNSKSLAEESMPKGSNQNSTETFVQPQFSLQAGADFRFRAGKTPLYAGVYTELTAKNSNNTEWANKNPARLGVGGSAGFKLGAPLTGKKVKPAKI